MYTSVERYANLSEVLPQPEPWLVAQENEAAQRALVRTEPATACQFAATQWSFAFLEQFGPLR